MDGLRQDLRQVARSVRKTPGFAAVVIATLAVTIAAVTVVFALLDAVILRPLPFAEPETLVAVWNARPEDDRQKMRVRALDFLTWREAGVFEDLALTSHASRTLHGAGDPIQLGGSRVTEAFFPLLGVEALHGRTFLSADFAPGAPRTVVLSHALWSRRFGADPGVVGRTVTLDREPYEVVGVLPRQVMPLVAWQRGQLELGSDQEHFWLPQDAGTLHPTSGVHGVLARLAPAAGERTRARAAGDRLALARERLDALARRLERERADSHDGYRVTLVPLIEEAAGDVAAALWLLLAAVGVTLAIACANLTNLFLARADRRRRELALRAVLGAGRLRLARLVLAEGAALAVAGAAAGMLLARWSLVLLPRWSPEAIPRLDEAALDLRAAALVLGLGLLCGLSAALVPALRAGRLDLETTLRAGGRGGGGGDPRLRRGLVAAEMALAIVLAIGAGLLVRSLDRLRAVDPGFSGQNVLTFKVLPHPTAFPEHHALTGFYDALLAALDALPGVAGTAASYDHPLDSNWTQSFRLLDGGETGERQTEAFRTVTPGYFDALGVERLAGRDFTAGDHAAAPGAAIVNQAFVRRYFPGRDPLGRRLALTTTHWRWGEDAIPSTFRIVGVVEDVAFGGLASPPEPAFYLPYAQTPHYAMTVVLRADRPPEALLPAIRATLRALDPGVPIAGVETLDALLDRQIAKPRFSTAALAGFGAGALFLALLGTWGVASYAIGRKRREIGVRMALGAARRRVFGWAVWHGLRPALWGMGAGLAAAAALTRLLRGLLYDVAPGDPATFVAVPLILLLAVFAACALPARRAARTDPSEVLREE